MFLRKSFGERSFSTRSWLVSGAADAAVVATLVASPVRLRSWALGTRWANFASPARVWTFVSPNRHTEYVSSARVRVFFSLPRSS